MTMSQLSAKLGTLRKITNGPSRNGYGKAPNQFIIYYENGEVFQSYETIVGVYIRSEGRYYFGCEHDCSNTTSGHVGRWCGYNAKERRKGLADGTFGYID